MPRLPAMASASTCVFAYSICEPLGRPRANRVTLTPLDASSDER